MHYVRHVHIIIIPPLPFPALRRVVALLDASRDKVVFGGEVEESERYVSPTLITNVTGEDKIMTEEIFGPLLPFVIVQNTDEAIEFIADRWGMLSSRKL